MGDFCDRCGSLLIWNFDGGRRVRKCRRCGLLHEEPSAGEVPASEGTLRIPVVQKGTRPRDSGYARRAIAKAATSREGPGPVKCDLKPPPEGIPFPFDGVRPGQMEFMMDVSRVTESGGALLAKVPTGIGKTAASLSPAVAHSLRTGRTVFFLTSKQSQHAIVVSTLRRLSGRCGLGIKVVDILSKQTMCPRDISAYPRYTFNHICKTQQKDGTCPYYRPAPDGLKRDILGGMMDASDLRESASSQRICPHRAALECAREANVIVCDFNYIFSDQRDAVLKGMGKDLDQAILIVDEGHNLPDRIRANQSSDLGLGMLEEIESILSSNRRVRPYIRDLCKLIRSEADRALAEVEEAELDRRMFISSVRSVFRSGLDEGFEAEDFLDIVERLSSERGVKEGNEDPLLWFIEFMRGLLQIRESHLLYFSRSERGREDIRLIYRNMDPSEISGPVIRRCHASVVMSGTLSPPSMFADILGISREGRLEKEYPSPFPTSNKMTLIDTTVTTAYNSRGEQMYERIAARIADAANATPGNCVAFFPSYSFLGEVKGRLKGIAKDLITEERDMPGSRKTAVLGDLERARRSRGSLLLAVMGGSLSEGLDYRDNLLETVVIVGLPLAPPSLDVMAIRDYSRRKWGYTRGEEYAYDYPAVNKMLQAAGRSIRSETDRSVILLLEKRYLEPRYLKFLPDDMGARAVTGDIGRLVSDFHSRGTNPRGT